MLEIDYQVKEVVTDGKQKGDVAWLKKLVEGRWWEVEGESVSLLLAFPEGKIHEIHLGSLSSLTYTVEAGTEPTLSDPITIHEGREYLPSKGIRLTNNSITAVSATQYQDFTFSRARVNFQASNGEKVLRLAYIGLFRRDLGEAKQPPATVRYSAEVRVEARDTYIIPKKIKKQTEIRSASPERKVKFPSAKNTPSTTNGEVKKGLITPTATKTPSSTVSNRSTTSRLHRKAPIVCSDPAETSYSSLLQNCVISCLSDAGHASFAGHISKLCECMGALYLDHLSEITTHVILLPDLSYNEQELKGTSARLVSVRWLETCLDEKTRQREDEYEVL